MQTIISRLPSPNPNPTWPLKTIKNPYYFDFLGLGAEAQERDIEKELIKRITEFMLELGKGFAYVGRQYAIQISDSEYFIDLLFYHLHLRCFVVIEILCYAQHKRSYVA